MAQTTFVLIVYAKDQKTKISKKSLKILKIKIVPLKTKVRKKPSTNCIHLEYHGQAYGEALFLFPIIKLKPVPYLPLFPLLVAKFSLMNVAKLQYKPYT